MWRQGIPVLFIFLPPLLAGPDLLVPNEYWLPGEVVPVHYDFKLVVHMGNLTTRGEVRVEVKVVKATSTITLHANSSFVKIDHDKVVVKGPDDEEVIVNSHKEDREKEFYIIELGSRLEVGQKVMLTLPYTGVIRDGRNNATVTRNSTDIVGNTTEQFGFYASPDGEWGVMALTKFMPNNARKALPCFDEAKLKATFTLSLARPKEYSSLGNMPLKEEGAVMEEDENYLWDHYKKSVKMSTYLLKWVGVQIQLCTICHKKKHPSSCLLWEEQDKINVLCSSECSQDTRPSGGGFQDAVPAAEDGHACCALLRVWGYGGLGPYEFYYYAPLRQRV